VVQGYKEDTAKVLLNGVHVATQLLGNSGILIGYSINHVVEAIEFTDLYSTQGLFWPFKTLKGSGRVPGNHCSPASVAQSNL
jgi:hypothetical protein